MPDSVSMDNNCRALPRPSSGLKVEPPPYRPHPLLGGDSLVVRHAMAGTSIPLEKLRLRDWVYLEGVSDRGSRRNLAKKIYFLPRYVDEKQKHLYPFME